jgi:hypothetical protein
MLGGFCDKLTEPGLIPTAAEDLKPDLLQRSDFHLIFYKDQICT